MFLFTTYEYPIISKRMLAQFLRLGVFVNMVFAWDQWHSAGVAGSENLHGESFYRNAKMAKNVLL